MKITPMYFILLAITSSFVDLGTCQPLSNKASMNNTIDKLSLSQNNSPFKLDVSEFPKVKLVNITNKKQILLYDVLMQPYVLKIFKQDGTEMQSFDSRNIMKYDNTIRGNMFKDIVPEEAISLPEVIMTKNSNDYEIKANTFRFTTIQPGTYTAIIEWTSAIDTYYDEEKSKNMKKDVWLGNVISDKITFTLN